MLRIQVFAAMMLSLMLLGAERFPYAPVASAYAQESWKIEFDDICAKTSDAMSLEKLDLKSLVERCDKLKPEIEKLDETTRKVYLKRLQQCRDLFTFVLDSQSK